jgi:hypothetical protein
LLDPVHPYHPWPPAAAMNNGRPLAIDPLGYLRAEGGNRNRLGPLNRITYLGMEESAVDHLFTWHDDLVFDVPDDVTLRPRGGFYDGNGNWTTEPTQAAMPAFDGSYSWLMTVVPSRAEAVLTNVLQKNLYSVSVVVCYKRTYTGDSEQTRAVAQFYGGGLGGGSIRLAQPINTVRENEWVMLFGEQQIDGRVLADCKWYRVVAAGKSNKDLVGPDMLTLVGPDWDVRSFPAQQTRILAIDGVAGVYSTTVELDRFTAWNGSGGKK